ncbi:hypothetical protein M9H77_11392 [Catharanthus roseus]|uniref:Uncharacterized protein n=1 Tax=Catharanthus roseus TaxID=4058 RepID=A0ACC0BEI3_CATRO|nr:hypothetical protein M9H77_11392 [Catharanthus roseus]
MLSFGGASSTVSYPKTQQPSYSTGLIGTLHKKNKNDEEQKKRRKKGEEQEKKIRKAKIRSQGGEGKTEEAADNFGEEMKTTTRVISKNNALGMYVILTDNAYHLYGSGSAGSAHTRKTDWIEITSMFLIVRCGGAAIYASPSTDKDGHREKVNITFYSCQYQNPNCHLMTV